MKTISKLCTTAALGMALLLATGASHVALAQDSAAAAITDKSAAGELAYWNQIKDSANASDFRTYLEAFPDGMFAEPALRRFEQAGGNKADLSADVHEIDSRSARQSSRMLNNQLTTEPPKVTQSSKTKVKPAVKTKKVAKTKSSKVKTKRVVQTKKRPKAVTAVRPNRSKPRISAAKPPIPMCRTGRIVNGRCVVKRATPAGGGGGNGGGGGGGTGGGGGGWGG